MIDYRQYAGKKVLLTGHTGFKGAWTVAVLHSLGAEIVGYALAPESETCLYNDLNIESLCTSVIGDIRDKSELDKVITDYAPDIVFHFAAQALVLKSYAIPSETFDVNVIGTANVLESIGKLNSKCSVVVVTTDKVYENYEWDYPYRENDRLGGYDPYSASKACAEIVVSSFRNSFFNVNKIKEHKKSIASVRAGNVIGGGDYSENRIIPDVIRALQNNKPVLLRNPNSVRPWQHVLEPIFSYLKIGLLLSKNPEKYSLALNIGPSSDDILTVEELVQKAIKVWGSGSYTIEDAVQHHEAKLLQLDISLASKLIDWIPVYNSAEAVEKTIQWYKEENKLEFTYKQIKDYLGEIS